MSEPWRQQLLAELADVRANAGRLCERVITRGPDVDIQLARFARIELQAALDKLRRSIANHGEF